MLRGVAKTIETGPRTVRYNLTRADLIKRLRLPADAVITVEELVIDELSGKEEPGHRTLDVEFVLAPKTKAAK